jgi:hypothetical protein
VHHKKVKQWFLNQVQYCHDIESEQKRHPGKCIYHLSMSYPTEDSSVKKECDHILADKQDSGTSSMRISSKSSEHLRNVKEEIFEDTADHDAAEDADVSANDANQDELYYFA